MSQVAPHLGRSATGTESHSGFTGPTFTDSGNPPPLHSDFKPRSRSAAAMLRLLSPEILRAMADARWCTAEDRAAFLAEAERQGGGAR